MTELPSKTTEEIAALDGYVKLMRAANSVTSRAHIVLPDGVTITQFGALEALLHLGPLSPTALADKLLKSGGNLTLVIDNLERAGLVARERKPEDRRHVTVSLTQKGHDFIQTLFPSLAASLAREFSVLSSGEQTELARLCKKLGLGHHAPKSESIPTTIAGNNT
ncbi:MAG TPA: MarR family transcriptional regulator [Opitutaceae bacterium]|nr:MarR family transcriptional regulator [Opitutaceae bacterium]